MRILFVGLGGAGQRHLRNVRLLLGQEARIGAWRQRRRPFVITETLTLDASRRVEDTYDVKLYDDLEAALADRPEAAVIATPSSLHLRPALTLAEAGCDLLIEKPLSHNLDGVERLVELADRNGIVGLVAYQMRFHPCARLVTQLVRDGAIGRVMMVRLVVGSDLRDWHTYEDYRELYAARADQGGGVILTEIHELDFLYQLFGLPTRVFALGGHLSDLELQGVEDTVSMLFEHHVDGHLVPAHVQLSFARRPAARGGEIEGSLGTIEWDYRAKHVRIFSVATGSWDVRSFEKFEPSQMFLELMRHFLACRRRTETPVVGLRDGLHSLRMAVAARRSLETGEPVAVTA